MKKVLMVVIAGIFVLVLSVPSMAYDIDGKLNDWGLDLINNSWSANQTWLPNYGIWFVVEDNADPNYLGENGIDLSKTGVHIRGMGKWFEKYDEPKIWDGSKWIIEPSPIQYVSVSGGEKWDIEAMYVDEDADYIYVAIITSQNSSGWNWGSNHYYPSDLALNLDADESTGGYGYEYGIKLSTEGSNGGGGVQFGIYKTSTNSCWTVPSYLAENKPSRIVVNNAQPNGTAIGAYKSLGKTDNGVKNWVIELAIPKENVGMKGKWLIGNPVPKVLHVTETCGNDHIDVPISVPEFLNLLIPVGILLGSVLYFKRRAK